MKQILINFLAAFGLIYIAADNIPSAVAQKASVGKHVLVVQAGLSKAGYSTISHDFSSRKSCESARRIVEKQLNGVRAAFCLPK